ncbi:hypothetical protein GCM10023307_11020 [Lysobacter hankyongensis]|uniref:Uncharacterized protein n=1 Tax=Lysobacter hankyongensis TaxID=1176535 RepID=A0ABP9B0W7_9GAMM
MRASVGFVAVKIRPGRMARVFLRLRSTHGAAAWICRSVVRVDQGQSGGAIDTSRRVPEVGQSACTPVSATVPLSLSG